MRPSRLLAMCLLCGPAVTHAAPKVPPLTGKDVAWSHAPFEVGECAACHVRGDAKDPGALKGPVNAGCLDCHEQMPATVAARPDSHPALGELCTACHNPHNSIHPKLLLAPPGATPSAASAPASGTSSAPHVAAARAFAGTLGVSARDRAPEQSEPAAAVVSLPVGQLFVGDSVSLQPEARRKLGVAAKQLASAGVAVRITAISKGPVAADSPQGRLCVARADAIVRVLVEEGLAAQSVSQGTFGSAKPPAEEGAAIEVSFVTVRSR